MNKYLSKKKTRNNIHTSNGYIYGKYNYLYLNISQAHTTFLLHFFPELSATKDVHFELFDTRDPDESKVKHYKNTVHPLGTVPALEIVGREPLIESGAICMYLAELYQKLLPKKDNIADYFK